MKIKVKDLQEIFENPAPEVTDQMMEAFAVQTEMAMLAMEYEGILEEIETNRQARIAGRGVVALMDDVQSE